MELYYKDYQYNLFEAKKTKLSSQETKWIDDDEQVGLMELFINDFFNSDAVAKLKEEIKEEYEDQLKEKDQEILQKNQELKIKDMEVKALNNLADIQSKVVQDAARASHASAEAAEAGKEGDNYMFQVNGDGTSIGGTRADVSGDINVLMNNASGKGKGNSSTSSSTKSTVDTATPESSTPTSDTQSSTTSNPSLPSGNAETSEEETGDGEGFGTDTK